MAGRYAVRRGSRYRGPGDRRARRLEVKDAEKTEKRREENLKNVPRHQFYRRLREAGKEHNVALVAVMRKLVVLANVLVQQDRLWLPEPPQQPKAGYPSS